MCLSQLSTVAEHRLLTARCASNARMLLAERRSLATTCANTDEWSTTRSSSFSPIAKRTDAAAVGRAKIKPENRRSYLLGLIIGIALALVSGRRAMRSAALAQVVAGLPRIDGTGLRLIRPRRTCRHVGDPCGSARQPCRKADGGADRSGRTRYASRVAPLIHSRRGSSTVRAVAFSLRAPLRSGAGPPLRSKADIRRCLLRRDGRRCLRAKMAHDHRDVIETMRNQFYAE